MKRFLKRLFGYLCIIETFLGFYLFLYAKDGTHIPILITIAIFAIIAYLCLRDSFANSKLILKLKTINLNKCVAITFMRKFMDSLNMDNWKKNDTKEASVPEQSPAPNLITASTRMIDIRRYWKHHPQEYLRSDLPNPTPEEYLLYGKTLMLYAYSGLHSLQDIEHHPFYLSCECHISNPIELYHDMLNSGYFSLPTIYELYASYTVPKLKEIAESMGLKKRWTQSGNNSSHYIKTQQ